MIVGLYIDFKTDELRTHLKERVAHHLERARWFAQQSDTLRETLAQEALADDRIGGDRTGSADNDRNPMMFKGHLKTHRREAQRLLLTLEHLAPNEVYRLSDKDCERLELIEGY